MASTVRELCITRGDHYSILVRVSDASGAPLDVVAGGYTPKMQLRPSAGSDTVLAEFAAVVGGASGNEITLTLTAVQTLAVEVDSAEARLMLRHNSDATLDQILRTRYMFTFEESPTKR